MVLFETSDLLLSMDKDSELAHVPSADDGMSDPERPVVFLYWTFVNSFGVEADYREWIHERENTHMNHKWWKQQLCGES